MRIVPMAVKDYFVYGTPIEDTIKKHTDIYDFCLRLKTNSLSTPYFRHFNDKKEIIDDTLGRTTRYYITTNGGILLKKFHDGKITGVNVGFDAQVFNQYVKKDMKDYKINYNFYIAEAYKLKNSVDTGQLKLFDDWF